MQNPDFQQQLEIYLQNLVFGIEQGHRVVGVTLQTVTSNDLKKFVGLGAEGDATLLRLLGYTSANVEAPPVKTTGDNPKFSPAYILRQGQQTLAVLELKAPHEPVDDADETEELLFFCREIQAPLGLLFNGYSLRVFIDTHIEALSDYQPWFANQPVGKADHTDVKHLAELLSPFAASAFQSGPVALANQLAIQAQAAQVQQDSLVHEEDRRNRILKVLTTFLSGSVPGDATAPLALLANADFLWNEWSPKPTLSELSEAWNATPIVVPPTSPVATTDVTPSETSESQLPIQVSTTHQRLGINPALRAKVAEVCALRGWEVIEQASIKSLNYRLDGGTDRGYRPVPSGPNVPPGLCIQGLESTRATKVLQALGKLIAQ